MRYSQPFGTPTPPLGTYPRYINGNPVTGTEGSIPPATSIDEDQIEIVTVIQNAGLTPSHDDLTQLWQAIMGLIAQKYITTAIVKKVHGAGADFIDLHAALDWLAQYIITPTGSVTFMIAAGRWVYTKTVEVNHPNANRVIFQGGALLGAAPASANISGEPNADIIYLRTVYATELAFTAAASGFHISRGGAQLRYLLLTGSQDVNPALYLTSGIGLDVTDLVYINGVSIWGFGAAGIQMQYAIVVMSSSLSMAIVGCGYGIHGLGGMFLSAGGCEVTVAAHKSLGIFCDGGWMWFDTLVVKMAGTAQTAGMVIYSGGFVACNPGSAFMYNTDFGVYCAGRTTFMGEGCTYYGNSSGGLYCAAGMAWVNNSSFGGHGGYDVVCLDGGYVELIGSGYSTTAPPVNTLSTSSYIIYG